MSDKDRDRRELVVPVDVTNEHVVLAAACRSPEERATLVRSIPRPDIFSVQENRAAWAAILELHRRNLEFSIATLQKLAPADVSFVGELVRLHPEAPANLQLFVDGLLWDQKRSRVARGPLTGVLESIADPRAQASKLLAQAKAVVQMLDGVGPGVHFRDPTALVEEMIANVRSRVGEARKEFPFGVRGLDKYEPGARDSKDRDVGGKTRLLAGSRPGMITLIAGSSGSGKSTLAARMTLGISAKRRRVFYCSWEPEAKMTLEILSCMSLGWSRTRLLDGKDQRDGESEMPPEQFVELEERAHLLSQWITIDEDPFRRRIGERPSNEANLDTLQERVAASGCDVVFCDLWERCLVPSQRAPYDEADALYRQQSMAKELGVHFVLLAQQKKEVTTREDKRPTGEGITGSGAWFQVADTILAPFRPALYKRCPDDKIEIYVLKQRWGPWPICVSFDWDGEYGTIKGGESFDYDPKLAGTDTFVDEFKAPALGDKRRGGKR